MLGKIEGNRRKGQHRMRWLDSITDSVDLSLTNSGIFSISPSNEYSELISFRTNGFEIVLFHLSSALLYDGKESSCNAGDLGSIPGLGRSPGEGNVNPLHYSCLENPMDREPGRL